MGAVAVAEREQSRGSDGIDRRADHVLLLLLLLLLGGALVFALSAGTALRIDDLLWAMDRRPWSPHTFLEPHNGHLSALPVLIDKALFSTIGIAHYWPYRVLGTLAHMAVVVLVYRYASARVGLSAAALAAAAVGLFGPGWEDILWPFQTAWLLAVGAGVAAFTALDRPGRRADGLACVLLAVALASASVGVAVLVGAAVDVLWRDDRRHRAWVVLVPALLYLAWWIPFHDPTTLVGEAARAAPRYVLDSAAATVTALAGMSDPAHLQDPMRSPGRLRYLVLAIALGLLLWRVARLGRVSRRASALLTVALVFWALTALGRGFFSPPDTSRYLYVGAVFVLLSGVELARGARMRRPVAVALAAVAVLAVVANASSFRDGRSLLRAEAQERRADLGALELARANLPARYTTNWSLIPIDARRYLDAADAYGAIGATPDEIASLPEPARAVADAELVHAYDLRLRTTPGAAACPAGSDVGPGGAGLDAGAFRVSATTAPVRITLRRFATAPRALGIVRPGSPALLRVPRDRASMTSLWRLAGAGGTVRMCAETG